MELDPQSRAVVTAITGSGVVPFRQFHPVEARAQLLKLRVERPAVPAHPMWQVSEETVTTPDGGFRIRVLEPREPTAGERLGCPSS